MKTNLLLLTEFQLTKKTKRAKLLINLKEHPKNKLFILQIKEHHSTYT